MPATRTSNVAAPKRPAARDAPIGALQKTRSRTSRTQIVDSKPRIPSPRISSPEDHYSDNEEIMKLRKEIVKLKTAERRRQLRDEINELRAKNPSSTEHASSSETLQASSSQVSAVPEPIPPFKQYMEARFVSLTLKYPFIHTDHFKNIAENKFLPENIAKLSTDYATVKQYGKHIKMDDPDFQIRENDAEVSDTKGIIQLIQSFLIYCQILLHFTDPTIYSDLNASLMSYVDRLLKHNSIRTFHSVRTFHFIFHKLCMIGGVDDPAI